jgi:FAD/FMN-containing dehydrogenase
MAAVQLRVLGGAVTRVPADATAFGYREAGLMVNITALHQYADERAEQQAWANSLMRTLSDGTPTGAYVGFLGDDEEGSGRAYPPATLERLAGVKRRYDPDNLFRLNTNVAPDVS